MTRCGLVQDKENENTTLDTVQYYCTAGCVAFRVEALVDGPTYSTAR
jgi:hypothetical protein